MRYAKSGNFNLIQNLTDDFIAVDVIGLCFVSQANAMAQYIMRYSSYILGNNITSTLDKGVSS
jgi:hypothetical protein